MKSNNLKWG